MCAWFSPINTYAIFHAITAEALWYATFINTTSKNGVPCIRDDALMALTLTHVLQLEILAPRNKWRLDLEALLKSMAASLVPLQSADGIWRTDALDAIGDFFF